MRSKLILLVKALGALIGGLMVAVSSSSSSAQIPHTETHRALLKAHTQARTEDINRQAERAVQEDLQRRVEDRREALSRDAERADRAEALAEKKAAEKKAAERAAAKKRAAEKKAAKEAAEKRAEEKAAKEAAEEKRRAKIRATEEKERKKQQVIAIKARLNGHLPVPSGVVIAGFGDVGSWARYHTGLDFRAAYGTPVRAVLPGRVIYAGNSGDWAGNYVVIRHDDGKKTLYAHMSSLETHSGAYVSGGSIIGRVGKTGRAFGAHLHFELYPVGIQAGDVYNAINPRPWLRDHGVKV